MTFRAGAVHGEVLLGDLVTFVELDASWGEGGNFHIGKTFDGSAGVADEVSVNVLARLTRRDELEEPAAIFAANPACEQLLHQRVESSVHGDDVSPLWHGRKKILNALGATRLG